jgi:hypothetical protein
MRGYTTLLLDIIKRKEQLFYCYSTSHIHGRVFNNETNSYPKTSVKWTLVYCV